MPPEETPTTPQANPGEQPSTPAASDAPDGGKPRAVPLEALEAERKQRQQLAAKLAEYEAADAERSRKAAEQAGEFETLYKREKAERETAAAELAALREREQARVDRLAADNEKRQKALPADFRALVPDGLDADAVAAHLAKLEKLSSSGRIEGTVARGPAKGPRPTESDVEADRQYVGARRDTYTADEWRVWFHEHVWSRTQRGQPKT